MKKKIQAVPITCPSDELIKKWIGHLPEHSDQWLAYKKTEVPTNNHSDWRLSQLPEIAWHNYHHKKYPVNSGSSSKQFASSGRPEIYENAENLTGRKHEQIINLAYNKTTCLIITKETSSKPLDLNALVEADHMLMERLIIIVEEGAQAVIRDTITSKHNNFVGRSATIILKENARLQYIVNNEVADTTHNFLYYRIFAQKNSFFDGRWVISGCGYAKCWADFYLKESGATINARFLLAIHQQGFGEVLFFQKHSFAHTTSSIIAKALINDCAYVVLNGQVEIDEGAPGSDANQQSAALLLSQNARASTVPSLEVKSNDVICQHGSAVGKLNSDDLFYLQARGQQLEAARNLLLFAFIQDCLPPDYNSLSADACIKSLKGISSIY